MAGSVSLSCPWLSRRKKLRMVFCEAAPPPGEVLVLGEGLEVSSSPRECLVTLSCLVFPAAADLRFQNYLELCMVASVTGVSPVPRVFQVPREG